MKRDTKKRDGPWGFGQMFLDECLWAEFKRASYRTETGIPSHYTTYSDAEVQVFTPIHPELILRAWVWKIEMSLAEAVQEQLNKIPQLERQTCMGPLKVFNNRHEVWLEPDES